MKDETSLLIISQGGAFTGQNRKVWKGKTDEIRSQAYAPEGRN